MTGNYSYDELVRRIVNGEPIDNIEDVEDIVQEAHGDSVQEQRPKPWKRAAETAEAGSDELSELQELVQEYRQAAEHQETEPDGVPQ